MKEVIRECMEDARTVNPKADIPDHLVEAWVTKIKESLRPNSRSQRLYDLLKDWSAVYDKPGFAHSGINAVHHSTSTGFGMHCGVLIAEGDIVVLDTQQIMNIFDISSSSWHTSIFDESYSDRINDLMDALEKALDFEKNRF